MTVEDRTSKPAPSESITICHRPDSPMNKNAHSSQLSMRTFVQFDSPHPSDEDDFAGEDDSSISPLSTNTPPSSGTRWIRFFPELSSHFSLSSPPATHTRQFTPQPPVAEQSIHESETPDGSSTPVESKPASSSSLEMIDDSSSCYSRKTSLTSAGSEYSWEHQLAHSRYAYKSADAFSILSPVTAGVFDDTSSVRRLPSSPRSKNSGNGKPLPETPPMQLAPLAFRRNASPLSHSSEGVPASSDQVRSPQSAQSGPTFTQAAEELEDTLAGFTARNGPAGKDMQILNGPLQISRGNMDMIASRPAPRPPVNALQKSSKPLARVLNCQRTDKHELFVGQKNVKKPAKHKGPFSFSVPGFGRKNGQSRLHLRSFSSSNMRSEMVSHARRQSETIPETEHSTGTDGNDNMEQSSPDTTYDRPRRPSSLGSERELPQRLPRLQTSKMQPVSHVSHLTPSSSAERILGEDRIPLRLGSSRLQGNIDTPTDRSFVSSSELRRSNTFVLPYQVGSLQAPEVVYELEARPPLQPSKVGTFPSSAPDRVIFLILDHSNSLDDLFNFATVNRNFYRVFKNNELQLIKKALFDMSPSAWELRQMSPPWDAEWQILVDPDSPVPEYTPTLYLRRYAQDIFVLAQLKSLILSRCASFLRHDTIRGLAGWDSTRATEVDDAFWRIWTFCRIFGCGKNREDKTEPQIDWLNGGSMAVARQSPEATSVAAPFSMNNDLFEPPAGFGRGNADGLSQNQLYDMTEVWTCLSVLLQPLHGKCAEARAAGIFEAFDVAEGDGAREEATLEEWTSYILTLGLSAVLCLSSLCESDTGTASTFHSAQSLGLTKWEPLESEGSRSSFLKEAVSKVYKLRERESSSPAPKRLSSESSIHIAASEQPTPQTNAARVETRSNPVLPAAVTGPDQNPLQDHRQRQAAFAAELRDQRNKLRNRIASTFSTERPISNYTVIMDQLDGGGGGGGRSSNTSNTSLSTSMPEPTPKPAIPARSLARLNAANASSEGVHMQTPPPYSQTAPTPTPQPPPAPAQVQVLDPADRAICMITQDLGFDEADAKWALKITDTGEGIDVDAAVALLYREHKAARCNRRPRYGGGGIISSVMNR